MVRKYFGTDGIRGKANEGAMTAETALRVGMAAGRVFRRGDHRHRVVIGKDTRLSGYMLDPASTRNGIRSRAGAEAAALERSGRDRVSTRRSEPLT